MYAPIILSSDPELICLSTAKNLAGTNRKEIYKLRVIDSNFTGKPEDIIDRSWHNLLQGDFRIVSTRFKA